MFGLPAGETFARITPPPMKTLRLFLVATLLLTGSTGFAAPHDFVHDARTALLRAKTTHRMEDLREARREILSIPHLKNLPRRKRALKEVENAIAMLQAGRRVEADKFIEAALNQLDEAAGAGGGR